MRDPRFKAVHRGGLLDLESHRMLAAWAADCAERVLPVFETCHPQDGRPREAIATARAWARGVATVGEAREASVAAHAAARTPGHRAATAAARAAGHAAGTAHMADHAIEAAKYARQAVEAADTSQGDAVEEERTWQRDRAPDGVRALVGHPAHTKGGE